MNRAILRVLVAFALFAGWTAPGAAMLPAVVSGAATSTVAPAQATAIAAEQTNGSDQRIAGRIRGIFSEIPSLAGVTVAVKQGVVTLGGTVPTAADRVRAEGIAGRVAGVATVENGIERDTSVGGGVAGLKKVSQQFATFVGQLPLLGAALLVALLVAAFGYLVAGLGTMWRRLLPNVFLAELVASAIRFVFVLGGVVVALNMLGAGTLMGAVLGGAGVVGIALGFAMRDTIENYVASLMLSLRQPFRPNDWVVIDSHEGRVIRLTSRATILMTLDGNHLRIPNSAVFKAVILNYTRNPQRRFDFTLGIGADDDPTEARHLGVAALMGLDFVLDSPEPQARVEDVGDSNIVIRFLGWIDQRETDWYKARSRAIPAVKQALESAGFAIPEPIYRLRIDGGATPVAGEAPSPQPAKARAPATTEQGDTRPENEIADMVDKERAVTPDDKDLLDPSRPVE